MQRERAKCRYRRQPGERPEPARTRTGAEAGVGQSQVDVIPAGLQAALQLLDLAADLLPLRIEVEALRGAQGPGLARPAGHGGPRRCRGCAGPAPRSANRCWGRGSADPARDTAQPIRERLCARARPGGGTGTPRYRDAAFNGTGTPRYCLHWHRDTAFNSTGTPRYLDTAFNGTGTLRPSETAPGWAVNGSTAPGHRLQWHQDTAARPSVLPRHRHRRPTHGPFPLHSHSTERQREPQPKRAVLAESQPKPGGIAGCTGRRGRGPHPAGPGV